MCEGKLVRGAELHCTGTIEQVRFVRGHVSLIQ